LLLAKIKVNNYDHLLNLRLLSRQPLGKVRLSECCYPLLELVGLSEPASILSMSLKDTVSQEENAIFSILTRRFSENEQYIVEFPID
jgi:hypothetical protein